VSLMTKKVYQESVRPYNSRMKRKSYPSDLTNPRWKRLKHQLPPARTGGRQSNCCLVGGHGTGETHIAVGWGLAARRAGLRVRFFTAAGLVRQQEEEQERYTLDRSLRRRDRAHLLICDELGYVTRSRGGVELLFRVSADGYERGRIPVTSNLAFREWGQVLPGGRKTAAPLDRLGHHCHIFEMNGESDRFRESMRTKRGRKAE
jgi:DNA replication protein DnaC